MGPSRSIPTVTHNLAELTQFTEYDTRGFYDFHYDTNLMVDRQITFLTYLSAVDEGGETAFPLLRKDGTPRYAVMPRRDIAAR